ncbi:MerR family transcriptional regulator [Gorillibacterium timonense]|uniref:MerR family transcriptional regulator n=1 Tax=Gorillibacterium timonense TaxID=1689269 RepID=UPI00071E48D1|nr:helix-turn-helix domain-containing protein [Gorillibacterium timonense]
MYKIGELSKLSKIPVKTLRYYDSEGLLIPDEIDRFTGYRYYSASRLADCYRIVALKELGFTLEEIKLRMEADSADRIIALIEAKQDELKNTLMLTESRLNRLEAVKQVMSEGETETFDLIIRSADTLRVAVLRKVYAEKEEAFAEIAKMKSLLPKNLLGRREVIINYETEYRESQFDLGSCVEITGRLPDDFAFEDKVILVQSDVATLVCKRQELEKAYPAMINDDINLPFEDDSDAVGKWKFLDVVPSEEQFRYGQEKSNQGVWLQELYFLPNGEPFWAVGGWTKGWLFTSSGYPERIYKNRYTLRTHQGKKLMFLHMKDYEHEARGGMPIVWVYEKVSDRAFSRDEIRIRDNTDYPFVPDETLLGSWKVRDFVLNPMDFDPAKQSFPKEELYFERIEFKKDGRAIAKYGQKEPYERSWTKGLLLDSNNEIAETYEVRRIDETDYLFVEWKSGDYTYGGKQPYWYVMVRSATPPLA